jgi:hypothetical protein
LTVSAASVVCSVDRTKWPVSAAASPAATVSVSRISPTRTTSGSWRIAARTALGKSEVSTRTSRWLIIPSLSLCSTSMGSSIVTMCVALVVLMWSIIAARVVVLPDPVGPVTSTIPRGSSASRVITAGRPSSAADIAPICTRRSTIPTVPRWRNAATRNRPTPDAE